MSSEDEPERREHRFGPKRARLTLPRPKVVHGESQTAASVVDSIALAREPILGPPSPSSRNPFEKRPKLPPRSCIKRVSKAKDDQGTSDDVEWYGYEEDDGAPCLLTLKRAPQTTQDVHWQRARSGIVQQHYRSASTLQSIALNKISDRVGRWQRPATCEHCLQGTQTVNYIGVGASVDVEVHFAHCARYSFLPVQ